MSLPTRSQPQPKSRKYAEYTPSFIPTPSNISYDKQSIEVEPSNADNESGIYRNAWFEFYDINSPIARKNLLQVFESGYQLPKSVSHPQFIKHGYKKSKYSETAIIDPGPTLHPADEESGSKPCLGHRPLVSLNPLTYGPEFLWMSYEDVDRRRRDLGSALTSFFEKLESDGGKKGRDVVVPGEVKDEMDLKMDTVCVWAVNSVEWQLLDLACQAYGKVITALYDSSNDHTAEFILNHAESPILYTTIDHLSTILELYPKLKYLRSVVLIHSDDELNIYEAHGQAIKIAKTWAKSLGIQLWDFEEFERMGRQHPSDPLVDLAPETIYSLGYTSGTTGQPKAAILTHGQSALSAACAAWGLEDVEGTITMSALPMAHIYQRVVNLITLNQGGAIGISLPNPLLFLQDIKLLKPTLLPSVPRVLYRTYQGVTARIAADGGLKALLFNYAVKTKIETLRSTGKIDNLIWDRIIFDKASPVKPLLGGNLRTIISGSATMSPDVLDFVQVAFGCRIYTGKTVMLHRYFFGINLELYRVRVPPSSVPATSFFPPIRYGLTETSAVGLRNLPKDPMGSFSIGTLTPFAEVKLVGVPKLGYFVRPRKEGSIEGESSRPRGELYIRAPPGAVYTESISPDPVSTKYTFGADRWIHTGDIAEIDEFGRFRIIDRKENITKLSNGLFVALEQIESLYNASPVVAQLFVYGDSARDYLVAIIAPVEGFGKDLNSSDLKKSILLALEEQAKIAGLKGYEKIRNIHVADELFSIESGTLTPTLKIQRKEAYTKYKNIIEELYKIPIPSLSPSNSGVGKIQEKL